MNLNPYLLAFTLEMLGLALLALGMVVHFILEVRNG